jgi:hypothetical protein
MAHVHDALRVPVLLKVAGHFPMDDDHWVAGTAGLPTASATRSMVRPAQSARPRRTPGRPSLGFSALVHLGERIRGNLRNPSLKRARADTVFEGKAAYGLARRGSGSTLPPQPNSRMLPRAFDRCPRRSLRRGSRHLPAATHVHRPANADRSLGIEPKCVGQDR